MKEEPRSQEEINKEIARKTWDSWIVDSVEENDEEQNYKED
jgi:hypothetical protein